MPGAGDWRVIFDSDAGYYGGQGVIVETRPSEAQSMWSFEHSMEIGNLPENSVLVLKLAM